MSTWTTETKTLSPNRVLQYHLLQDGQALPYSEALQLWQDNELFRSFFIGLLEEVPLDAFFWETPPVNEKTLERPFEFVLVDSSTLRRLRPNRRAFAQYFQMDTDYAGVVTFPNLRGDAQLVVPCPMGEENAYPHLAAFIRQAPEEQVHAFWQMVGNLMQQHIGPTNTWLSTAGLGVSWLHVRLDSRPKYYRYDGYRNDSYPS